MTKVYPAIIHKEDSGFWMEFPDLSGCYTEGDTLEELMKNAEEALGAFLAVKMDYGEAVPEASDISVAAKGDGDCVTYVSADVNKYRKDTKAVKKMLSIPAWLAKEAEANNISLSKVLQDALLERLNIA